MTEQRESYDTDTHNLRDWGTNAYLAAGKIKETNRYNCADEGLKHAVKNTVSIPYPYMVIHFAVSSRGTFDETVKRLVEGVATIGQKGATNRG